MELSDYINPKKKTEVVSIDAIAKIVINNLKKTNIIKLNYCEGCKDDSRSLLDISSSTKIPNPRYVCLRCGYVKNL